MNTPKAMPKKPFQTVTTDQLKRWSEVECLSMHQIAKLLDCDRDTVKRLLARRGIAYRPKASLERPGEQDRIDALIAEGRGDDYIAKAIGRSRSFVAFRRRPVEQRALERAEAEERKRLGRLAAGLGKFFEPETDMATAMRGRRFDDVEADTLNREPTMHQRVQGWRLRPQDVSFTGNSMTMVADSISGQSDAMRQRRDNRSILCRA